MKAMPTTVMQKGGDVLAAWRLPSKPYYQDHDGNLALFQATWAQRLPLLLRGPTGCGKTRLVEHMAWQLKVPLITIACNEDTTAGDLLGQWLMDANGTRWQDGPLTLAARHGAMCYLDEVVEARADTLVAIHPLTDTRRALPLEGNGELLAAHPDFMLVASYNPAEGRQLKASTRQRFCVLTCNYPNAEQEAEILVRETGIAEHLAKAIVDFGARTRRLADTSLSEGASTRTLVRAAQLVVQGMAPRTACAIAIAAPLTDAPDLQQVLHASIDACLGD